MLHKFHSLLLLLFIFNAAFSQQVKVVNEYYEPIENTVIYNASNSISTITNYKGIADLSLFSISDTLYFYAEGYEFYSITIDQLIINELWVFLEQANYLLPSFEMNTLRNKKIKLLDENLDQEIISEEKLIELNAQTSADALKASSGITIQKSQLGGGSPIIRGFEANRVLLVIDGVRMNNAIYRSGHLQNSITLDNNTLSQIDIQYGPGSVIYGSDAIGGVVHFQTKDPKLSSDSTIVNGSTLFRYNNSNDEMTAHADFSIGGNKMGSLTSITYNKFNDLRMGSNRYHGYEQWGYVPFQAARINDSDTVIINPDSNVHVGSGYAQFNIHQKFIYTPNDKVTFKVNAQLSSSSNIPRYDRLNNIENGVPEYSEWYYGPQNRFLLSFSGEFDNYNKIYDKASIIASYQKIEEDRITRPFNSNFRSTREEDVAVYALNFDFIKILDSTKQLYFGKEFTFNNVWSNASSLDIISGNAFNELTRYPDGGSNMFTGAFYGSFRWQMNQFNLQTGLRYSHTILNASFIDTSFIQLPFNDISTNNGALSGSFQLAYDATKNTHLNLDISSGYRAPNIDDFGKIFKKDNYVVVPNNALSSEYAYSCEIGLVQAINNKNTSPNKRLLTFRATAFATFLDNAIIRIDHRLNGEDSILFDGVMCKIRTNANIEKALVYGATSTLQLYFSKYLSFSSSLNYTKGKVLDNNEPFGHIPPVFGRSRFLYEKNKWDVELFTEYNGWKKIEDYATGNVDNPNEATKDGTPPWYTLNVRLGIELNRLLHMQIAGYNLMDAHYKPFASGISAPGRSVMISIRSVF